MVWNISIETEWIIQLYGGMSAKAIMVEQGRITAIEVR
jgi:hypothetical protein